MDSSVPVISAVFPKKTAAERTTAAKEIPARKERECNGQGKYLAQRISQAKDRKIYKWYEDQDEEYEKKLDRKFTKCQFEKTCVQMTTWAFDYDFDMQRLRLLQACPKFGPETAECQSMRTVISRPKTPSDLKSPRCTDVAPR